MLFTSFGISKFAHYCGDEISSESFFLKDTGTCGCDDEEEDSCCHDQAKYIQALHEFTHTPTSFPSAQIVSLFNVTNISVFVNSTTVSFPSGVFNVSAEEYSPPIHILNRSILI